YSSIAIIHHFCISAIQPMRGFGLNVATMLTLVVCNPIIQQEAGKYFLGHTIADTAGIWILLFILIARGLAVMNGHSDRYRWSRASFRPCQFVDSLPSTDKPGTAKTPARLLCTQRQPTSQSILDRQAHLKTMVSSRQPNQLSRRRL